VTLTLTSTTFTAGGEIPQRCTCEGKDVSPALDWRDAPAGTKSFALVVDDPDAPDPAAPKIRWVHWVLYNIPASTYAFEEGGKPPAGSLDGINDWKETGYRGPCPPIGRHRYFHKIYALDSMLPDLKRPTRDALERAMDGHILAKAELMGTYQKQRK
jgi:Raf kinase inhibitor-like YbhB/YbcL family protein